MLIDVHQHVWTRALLEALAERSSAPRVSFVEGRPVLISSHEPPHVIDLEAEAPGRRSSQVEADGLDLALVAISSPIGIEALPRRESMPLIDAQLTGVASLGPRFEAWGPIPLDQPNPADVDRALERGCVGISLPAGALASLQRAADLAPTLRRISERRVPLFVHPGPALGQSPPGEGPAQPGWWAPLTGYVSQMQAAWLSFVSQGRFDHPQLVVVFAMLAGTAPLLAERLSARGGPRVDLRDPRILYDTSSFGPVAVEAMARQVGAEQLVYGSDRPVVEPAPDAAVVALRENAARRLVALEVAA